MSTINLLPDDYVQRRSEHRANTACIVLFAVVMVGVLSAVMVSQRRLQHTKDVLEQINNDYAKASELISQMQKLEAEKQQVHKKAQVTASLLERIPRSTLLAVITNARPKDVSLAKFELTTASVTREQPKPAGKVASAKFKAAAKAGAQAKPKKDLLVKTEIIGYAGTDVDVANFIRNLQQSPLTLGVDLQYTKETKVGDVPVREFKVALLLRPDVDAIVAAEQLKKSEGALPSLLKSFLGAKS